MIGRRLGALLLLAACTRAVTSSPATAAPQPTGDSIYLLDVDGLDVFRGHPVVIGMFYGRCPAACPLTMSTIQWAEDRLPAARRDDLRVLLVSFDAEHDTPAALAELADRHGADPARWRLTSLPEDDARALANVLGIHYRQIGDRFQHDVVFTVLDRDGRVAARHVGVPGATDALVHAILEGS
jgi:protein SCO1/2